MTRKLTIIILLFMAASRSGLAYADGPILDPPIPTPSQPVTVTLPTPYEIPPPPENFDLSQFWDVDNWTGMISVAITFPKFQNVDKFFIVLVFITAILIGFRLIRNILGDEVRERREQSRIVEQAYIDSRGNRYIASHTARQRLDARAQNQQLRREARRFRL